MCIRDSSLTVASQLDSVLEVNKERTTAASSSQAKIDSTQIKTDKAATEYKSVSKQIEGLKVYNAQKRKQIKRQKERMVEIEKTMKYASVLQRQIPPLARRMHSGLDQFVKLDLPFNTGERTERLKFIKDALDNPTVSPAEKLRQVLEGFNIEAEYGRKIDTYEDKLSDGTVVNILVIGRIGMFYQTKDERTSGRWDNETGSWEELPSSYRKPIRDGIRMAKKLAPIDMLLMPVVKGEA